ncbi:MAG TPA: ABC transporter permease [Anaerolineales bacterium]|jgi:simple sugar transport system permease protein|nr:ABC transporter permease [Anaerolineales bacterium]|tara:strand:+ start:316 stop:1272 length:957 start_codon:yes stop_codon:yes gene_type:complete
MDIGLLASILSIAIAAGTSLVFATVGEIVTERAGILNLGVEGMMIMGAVAGFAAAFHTESVAAGVLTAMAVGGMMAFVHAFLTITLLADQVVSGLALTLLGSGLASFLGQHLGPGGMPLVGQIGPRFGKVAIPFLSELPLLGPSVFNRDILSYVMYCFVPVAWYFVYRTRPGLYLRAIGESPQTADAMGVNVFALRYLYTVVGGMLVGLGGAHLSLSYTPGWTENITGGRGWIVIALVIFATWNPVRAVLGALLFGSVNAVQFRLQASGTTIPAALLNMLPYILTIVVLVVITWAEAFRKRVGAPASLGLPYMREERT